MNGLNAILSMVILFSLLVNAAPILPSGNGTVIQLLATRDDVLIPFPKSQVTFR
jgi:hypothetical protein